MRPGDAITYRIEATAVGGWPVPRVTLSDDLSDVLDNAELEGDVELRIGDAPGRVLPVQDGSVDTGEFVLPGTGNAAIVYTVRVPEDMRAGTLRNSASGEAFGAAGSAIAPQECGTVQKPCTTEHRITAPEPLIDKQMSPDSGIARGDTVSYTVRVTNPGPGAWTEGTPLSVIDELERVLDDAQLLGEAGAEVTVLTSDQSAAGKPRRARPPHRVVRLTRGRGLDRVPVSGAYRVRPRRRRPSTCQRGVHGCSREGTGVR